MLHQWNQLKSLIVDSQEVSLSKVRNYISNLTAPTLPSDYSKLNYDNFEKTNATTNQTGSTFLDEGSWKYRPLESHHPLPDKKEGYLVSLKAEERIETGKG